VENNREFKEQKEREAFLARQNNMPVLNSSLTKYLVDDEDNSGKKSQKKTRAARGTIKRDRAAARSKGW
jgi:hypothetical protein